MAAGTPSTDAAPGAGVRFHHVDVFTDVAYAGNSVAVFVDPPPLTTGQMSTITKELRHFESIFVAASVTEGAFDARVFDLSEELDFAGHPVLGAAAVLHGLAAPPAGAERAWTFRLPARTVGVLTRGKATGSVSALLDQGRPELLRQIGSPDRPAIAAAVGLAEEDLHPTAPPEVLSTGLRYLIVPVRGRDALARAHVARPDLEAFLSRFGAQFAYLLDPTTVEGRHWNNDGVVEDVATGSAAGCVAAYLMRHEGAGDGERIALSQGRFTGRPAAISITAYGTPEDVRRVRVGGDVATVGTGVLHTLPSLEH